MFIHLVRLLIVGIFMVILYSPANSESSNVEPESCFLDISTYVGDITEEDIDELTKRWMEDNNAFPGYKLLEPPSIIDGYYTSKYMYKHPVCENPCFSSFMFGIELMNNEDFRIVLEQELEEYVTRGYQLIEPPTIEDGKHVYKYVHSRCLKENKIEAK